MLKSLITILQRNAQIDMTKVLSEDKEFRREATKFK